MGHLFQIPLCFKLKFKHLSMTFYLRTCFSFKNNMLMLFLFVVPWMLLCILCHNATVTSTPALTITINRILLFPFWQQSSTGYGNSRQMSRLLWNVGVTHFFLRWFKSSSKHALVHRVTLHLEMRIWMSSEDLSARAFVSASI